MDFQLKTNALNFLKNRIANWNKQLTGMQGKAL
jgi:hypothetical protein